MTDERASVVVVVVIVGYRAGGPFSCLCYAIRLLTSWLAGKFLREFGGGAVGDR